MQWGAWSKPVEGLRGRLAVTKGKIIEGTMIPRIDLDLENISDVDGPIEVFWDVNALFVFHVEDEDGQPVQRAALPQNITRVAPYWLAVPHHGNLRVDVGTGGSGVPVGLRMLVDVPGPGVWAIPKADVRRFFLRGTLTQPPITSPSERIWHGPLELPRVELRW